MVGVLIPICLYTYVNWSTFGYLYQIYPQGWFSQLYINILQGLPVKA